MSADVLVDHSCLDTHSRYSGTGRYVVELGKALAALSDRERHGLSIGALTAIDGDRQGALGWSGSERPRWNGSQEVQWLNARRIRLPLTLRRLRPRLFHATYHMGTPRGSFVPRVVTCLDLIRLVLHRDYLPGRPAYRRVLQATEAARFHAARRVLAISRHTADDLRRLLGVPLSKVDVVHLGVDLERYRTEPEPTDTELLRKYRLKPQGYVFYMGAADPRKNVDTLIDAFARANQAGLELVLIGKLRESDQRAVDAGLAAAGSPAGVRSLGFVPEEELPAIVRGALAFVFCSTYEGFGNVPLEAMACGCPVITTGLTSMKETCADVCLLVPPRDSRATADAIRRIAREPKLREELSRAGAARAARFSWRNTALGTVDSYLRALRS